MNYFKYTGDKKLLKRTSELRRERTEKSKRPFLIKNFHGISKDHVSKLSMIEIKNVEQIIEAGKTEELRNNLANRTGVPVKYILEITQLSDITRVGYVKSKLARLYYNAGIRSPLDRGKYTPEELQKIFQEYIEKSGWEGQIPFLADFTHNIACAKKLTKIVE